MKEELLAGDPVARDLIASFISLLKSAASEYGGLPELAADADVGEDDLQRWIDGKPPMERTSALLKRVDSALKEKLPDYPPEGHLGGLRDIAGVFQDHVKGAGASGEQPDGPLEKVDGKAEERAASPSRGEPPVERATDSGHGPPRVEPSGHVRSVDLQPPRPGKQLWTRRRIFVAVGLAVTLIVVVALVLRSSDKGGSPVATVGRDISLPGRSPTRSVAPAGNATVPGSVQRPYADPNGPGTAKVTWGQPDSDGGKPIIQYRIRAYDVTANKLLDFQYTTGTAKTFADLTDGHVYRFKIEAINDVGLGPVVDTNTISPPAARL